MRLISLLLVTLVLGGCVHGTQFNWDQARQIRSGMTTAQVSEIMGKPYLVKSGNGMVRYVWTAVDGLTFETKTLAVDFVDGKVVNPPPIPTEFK